MLTEHLHSPIIFSPWQLPDIADSDGGKSALQKKTKSVTDRLFSTKEKDPSLQRQPTEDSESLNLILKEGVDLEKSLSILQNHLLHSSYSGYDENVLRTTLQSLKVLMRCFVHKTSKKKKRIKLLIGSTIKEVDKKIGQFSLERLVAKKKGEKIRNTTITSNFINSLLSQDLKGVNSRFLSMYSKAIARQILEIMEDPDRYLGKSLQLKKNEKTYPFFSFFWNTTMDLNVNFPFWLELSEDAKKIQLFIVADELNKGSYKKVSVLHNFSIDLKLNLNHEEIASEQKEERLNSSTNNLQKIGRKQYLRDSKYSPKVLLEAVDEISVPYIERGILLQEKIHDLCPDAFISPLAISPKDVAAGTYSLSQHPFHYQDWCNGDLNSLLKNNDHILLDLKSTPHPLPLYFEDILGIFIDIGESLKQLHKHGIVHKDIKPDNIFIKATGLEDKKVKGLLADFDLSQFAGVGNRFAGLPYYNYFSKNGFFTPFADVYGLTMCLINSFLTYAELSSVDAFLDEEQRAKILWKVLQKGYHEKFKDTPLLEYENFQNPNAKFIKEFINELDELIDYSSNDTKEDLQEIYGEIIALIDIISLIGEVVSIEKKLKSNFQIERGSGTFEWVTINDKRKNSVKIIFPDFAKLKLDIRQFFGRMENIDRKERYEHPFYSAFKNHLSLEDPCVSLKKEIALMKIPSIIKNESDEILENCNDLNLIIEKHIWLFLQSAYSKELSKDAKKECSELYSQIIELQKIIQYINELKIYYEKNLALIKEQAMPINLFVARLNEIKQKYILTIKGDDR